MPNTLVKISIVFFFVFFFLGGGLLGVCWGGGGLGGGGGGTLTFKAKCKFYPILSLLFSLCFQPPHREISPSNLVHNMIAVIKMTCILGESGPRQGKAVGTAPCHRLFHCVTVSRCAILGVPLLHVFVAWNFKATSLRLGGIGSACLDLGMEGCSPQVWWGWLAAVLLGEALSCSSKLLDTLYGVVTLICIRRGVTHLHLLEVGVGWGWGVGGGVWWVWGHSPPVYLLLVPYINLGGSRGVFHYLTLLLFILKWPPGFLCFKFGWVSWFTIKLTFRDFWARHFHFVISCL